MDITKFHEFANHEFVSLITDKKTGLRGVIAIHNTHRGPAAGATRYWCYLSEELAIRDAMRLSRGMTYKCALAGVPFGGGKGVIIADRKQNKTDVLRAYARRVDMLHGNFYTGEDVGMNKKDVRVMAGETKFIIGKSKRDGKPAYWTALGAFLTIERLGGRLWGRSDVRGRSFAVRGLGKVGFALAQMLVANGGNVIGTDIDTNVLRAVKRKLPQLSFVRPDEIHKQKVDVYAPCALGGEFSQENIRQLRCGAVCGCANNQLSTSQDGYRIHRRNILYVPDYLVNAGGMISVVAELDPLGHSQERVLQKVKGIPDMAEKIIRISLKTQEPTSVVADKIAERMFKK